MKKRESIFPIFLLFLILSITIFVLSKNGILSGASDILDSTVYPVQKSIFDLSGLVFKRENDEIKKLKSENKELYWKLQAFQNLEKENAALKDQFQTTYPKSNNLLPAVVISAPSFMPDLVADFVIIDKGERDKVKAGQAVVFKNNLVGRVSKTSKGRSVVTLLINKNFVFAAKDSKTGALGVIKGKGNEDIIFENILVSDDLRVSDIVLTKGDINLDGTGILADLIVGKIASIDKKPSALFQTAKIESLVDFTKLSTVFVVLQN